VARELQNRVLDLIDQALNTTMEREVCPSWLRRPGAAEAGALWTTLQAIYTDLTGGVLPDEMPPRERRSIDAVLTQSGVPRIVEIDEMQHFTPPRARTLALYPPGTKTAYDRTVWATRAAATTRLPGGGFARPKPPLFPEPGGRHLQRAFRDAIADLLPSVHGWAPTLRVGDFEVAGWLHADDAVGRMRSLLAGKRLGLSS
jgi:hypothetical protein